MVKYRQGQSIHMVEAMTVHKGELSEGQEPGDGEGSTYNS